MNNKYDISLESYDGEWTSQHVKHLLKRVMFGATREDINYFSKLPMIQCVGELLKQRSMPAPPINNYNDSTYTDPEIQSGQPWVNTIKYNANDLERRLDSYKSWWMGLAINQDRSILEKMVLFWHNHFVTQVKHTDKAVECYHYNTTIRKYALGNFKDFVKAISIEPQMLAYLNGALNKKQAPDENYARELQELFTIGKGQGSHYTQADVEAAARVLTGFSIDYNTFTGIFFPSWHDQGDKHFSSFYNNTIIKGRVGLDGKQELDDLLTMIFGQQEVSRFICRKLYRFFIFHDIDENTEAKVITPLAAIFRNNNYEIMPVLQALFTSAHFYDPINWGCIIKSPIDFIVGLTREFGIGVEEKDDYVDQYKFNKHILNSAAQLQQELGNPPNVAGWPAYYQSPQFDRIWINSDSLPKRNQFTTNIIDGGIKINDKLIIFDPLKFAKILKKPANPDDLISESLDLLLTIDLDPEKKIYLKSNILLSGLQADVSDHYWTQAWQNLTDKPNDLGNKNDVLTKLKNLYKYILNLPHYQLC